MNFLITGLPRSKTAWMSAVASSVAGAMCFHEPMKRFKSWECCFEVWQEKYLHVGIADAHMGFHLASVIERANPKILVIRRDLDQVKASLEALGGPQTNYPDLLAQALDQFMAHPNVAWVTFDALKSIDIVKQCLQFLMPGCLIDDNRIRELLDVNIQVDMERVWDCAFANRSRADQMLGPDTMAGLGLFQ